MKKRQPVKQKKEKHQEPSQPLSETVVSKYPQIEDKAEEKEMSSSTRKAREETPSEKSRREQDEAEKAGTVHSAITIDKDGNPVQEHTAGA